MIESEFIEVKISSNTAKHYKELGYEIPFHTTNHYKKGKFGQKIKNGVRVAVKRGTTIMVKSSDLMKSSNQYVKFICKNCNKSYEIKWANHSRKKSQYCGMCKFTDNFKGGCHSYWFSKLIVEDPFAKCDISGESDRRFLVLHHLLSRKNGGKDHPDNYVILSANYHHAFHIANGGMNIPSTPEQYYKFKELEKIRGDRRSE